MARPRKPTAAHDPEPTPSPLGPPIAFDPAAVDALLVSWLCSAALAVGAVRHRPYLSAAVHTALSASATLANDFLASPKSMRAFSR